MDLILHKIITVLIACVAHISLAIKESLAIEGICSYDNGCISIATVGWSEGSLRGLFSIDLQPQQSPSQQLQRHVLKATPNPRKPLLSFLFTFFLLLFWDVSRSYRCLEIVVIRIARVFSFVFIRSRLVRSSNNRFVRTSIFVYSRFTSLRLTLFSFVLHLYNLYGSLRSPSLVRRVSLFLYNFNVSVFDQTHRYYN